MAHRIAVIGGDGIGPEVVAEALKVVRAAGVDLDTIDYDLGGARYLRDGEVLPDAVLDELRGLDAILLGAVGTPEVPPGVLERGLLLKLRFELDLYVNLRPFVAPRAARLPGHPREHRGHLRRRGRVPAQGHAPRGRHPGLGQHPHRRRALRPLRLRAGPAPAPPHLTLVHKTNVLTFAGDLWQRTFDEVAAEFPDVATPTTTSTPPASTSSQRPERYDVIVTDNLFGDILTDLGGAVSGGIGLAASANLNPARTGPSLFEPVHGSAPDIVGTGKANPIAAILSAAMMLDFLGEADAAARIRKACADEPASPVPPPRSATLDRREGLRPCPSPRPRRSG